MKHFFNFLEKTGGMHDCVIGKINLDLSVCCIAFSFKDIYANFDGLSEYPGKTSGIITLKGVSRLSFNVEMIKPLKVFEFLKKEGEPDTVLISFSPAGSIEVECHAADYPLPALSKA